MAHEVPIVARGACGIFDGGPGDVRGRKGGGAGDESGRGECGERGGDRFTGGPLGTSLAGGSLDTNTASLAGWSLGTSIAGSAGGSLGTSSAGGSLGTSSAGWSLGTSVAGSAGWSLGTSIAGRSLEAEGGFIAGECGDKWRRLAASSGGAFLIEHAGGWCNWWW